MTFFEIDRKKLDKYFLIFFGVSLTIISILNVSTGDYLMVPINALFFFLALIFVRYDL